MFAFQGRQGGYISTSRVFRPPHSRFQLEGHLALWPGYAEGWVLHGIEIRADPGDLSGHRGLLRFLFGPGGFMRDKEFDRPGETSAGEGGQDRADDSRNTDGPHA
jgi:hypothetical protein